MTHDDFSVSQRKTGQITIAELTRKVAEAVGIEVSGIKHVAVIVIRDHGLEMEEMYMAGCEHQEELTLMASRSILLDRAVRGNQN